MIPVLILVVAVSTVAVAQVMFKSATNIRNRRLFGIAIVLFGVAQIGFFLALRGLEVGVVYMATGLTHVLVLAISAAYLRERVTSQHLTAVALIVIGLLLYGIG